MTARSATGAVVAVALLASAGCGGGSREPAIAAQTLRAIPADALVALHLSTDRRRGPVRVSGPLARKLPSWPRLQRDLLRRVAASGCGIDLRRRPGRELTFALLPASGDASTSLLVTDAPAQGLRETPTRCGALVARRVGRLVAIGEPAGVAAAAAAAGGTRPSLAASPIYRAAAGRLPAARVLDAWASARGTRDLLAPLGGLYGTLAGLVDLAGLRGAAAALVPRDDGASIVIRRVAASGPGSPQFKPTLQGRAPAGTLTYSVSGDFGSGLERFLLLAGQDAARAPAIADIRALRQLGRLGQETATLLAPGQQGPAVTLLSRVRDPRAVRRAMAGVEPVLARVLAAPATALWADTTPAGLRARTLANARGGLTWALDGDTLILSTALDGVSSIVAGGPRLAAARRFRAVTGNPRNQITSLVFLDPDQLLRLGADTGLGPASALEGSRADLARVRSVGITTTGSSRTSTVDLSLWIP